MHFKSSEAPKAATFEASNLSATYEKPTMNSIATAVSTINVPFHGAELYVINHNGEPYTPMKPIVEGMGMAWQSQLVKIKQRFNTCVTEIVMQLPGDNQRRSVVCIALRKLAGWLQTISPNKVKPEIRDRVIQYQEECDDVLYEYWTKGQVTNPRSVEPAIDMMNIDLHLRIRDGQVESIERLGPDMFVGKVEQILSGLRQSGWIVIKRDLLAEKLATW